MAAGQRPLSYKAIVCRTQKVVTLRSGFSISRAFAFILLSYYISKGFRMKYRRLSIAVALLSACLSIAPARSQMNKINITEYDLPNGLHVILHKDQSAPVVSTLLHYRVGSRDENPARTGFAHFFEHLMFEGTKDIPRASIDKYVQEAGGELNAYTSFDETVYFFQLPANELQLALWIEHQRMRNLLVDNKGVETQRGVVKEERRNRYDNAPYGSWNEKIFTRLFHGGSYGWTPIGSTQHIDSAAISEFVDFYNRFYQPSNATLVVAGDFDEAKAREYVDSYFAGYPRGAEIKREAFKLPELTSEYREVINDPKAQLPGVFIGFRGPKIGEPDYYAMSMLTDILAQGESSRLYQRLVDKEQIAVEATSFPFSLQYAGAVVAVGIGASGKDIGEVERMMYDEINKVAANGISDEEFKKARNIKEAEFVQGKKGVFDKARTLARYYTYFGDANMINTEIDQYMKVTKEDLQRVAKKYLTTDKRVVLVYKPGAAEAENQAPSGR